jgi:hypothetical protein
MQRDRHLASRNLRRESAPLSQGSRASLLVDLPRDEMAASVRRTPLDRSLHCHQPPVLVIVPNQVDPSYIPFHPFTTFLSKPEMCTLRSCRACLTKVRSRRIPSVSRLIGKVAFGLN